MTDPTPNLIPNLPPNLPDVVAEVRERVARYEQALIGKDVDVLDHERCSPLVSRRANAVP